MLALGDGAVHGEEAYCFGNDMVGVPAVATDGVISNRHDLRNQGIPDGSDLEKGNGNGGAPEVGLVREHQETKID